MSDVTIEWLSHWPKPWFLGEIDPSVRSATPHARHLDTEAEVRAYLDERNGHVNLYFVPNVVRRGVNTTPKKDDIEEVLSLYVDYDLPKTDGRSTQTETGFQNLLSVLDQLEPPPTAVVRSGGGFQAFWRFPEPLPADAHLEQVEAASKSIAQLIRSDAVQNVNRWMRLPGTLNLPNARKRELGREPVLATVEWANWSQTWSFDDPIPTAVIRPLPISSNDQRTYHDLPAKWRKIVKTGNAEDYDNDRSRMVFALILGLVRRGWSDEEVLPFLVQSRWPSSAHCLAQASPEQAARRQIERARAMLAASASPWELTSRGKPNPSSLTNVRRALTELGFSFAKNLFNERLYVSRNSQTATDLNDEMEAVIRINVCDEFNFLVNKEFLSDVVTSLARDNGYHPVLNYLANLTWDGVPRLDSWLPTYCGAEETEFVRRASELTFLSAVRRIRDPGCKFDQMLVLINPEQGTNKSSLVATMAVKPEWFSDSVPLGLKDKEAIEQLSGFWIVEIAELQGMRQNEIEGIKSFITRVADRARLAYGRRPVTLLRQCIFIGTSNHTAFLRDTKNRRFWPVRVGRIDLVGFRQVLPQLWAEASHREAQGEPILLEEHLWADAADLQEEARVGDPWTDTLRRHLALPDGTPLTGRIANTDVYTLIGKPIHLRGQGDNLRLIESMREIGWEKRAVRFGRSVERAFVSGTFYEQKHQVIVVPDPLDPRGPPIIGHTDPDLARRLRQASNPEDPQNAANFEPDIPF